MSDALLLVRHTAVAKCWAGRCYGRGDAGLSRAGAADARSLAPELANWRPDFVFHSGLRRTQFLAERIAAIAGVDSIADPGWQERDFGSWEGQRWSAIYRATGNTMDGMIDDPARFRPGGGETSDELAARACAALDRIPSGRVIVVAHGGPIAAIRGVVKGLAVREWLALVPGLGQSIVWREGTAVTRFGAP